MYDSLRIISCTLNFIRMTLHAYVLCISVRRQASHNICISYAKHDDDRLMSLKRVYPSFQKNLDYNYTTSHNIIEQTKERNVNTTKELVYALDSPVFDYAFVDAHDLLGTT